MSDKMESLIDKKMATTNESIETSVQDKLKDIGVTYVRWARKSCPNATELVYTGKAGGNHPEHKGGGSNYICLPNDSDNGQFQPHDTHVLFGVEYQTFYNSKLHGWLNSLGDK
ncbi:uncharacterized protein LOC127706297 [Mytilus californianus]|uniref:uncharacterized protein LOC127706297 n=1 Tax=Mytilus californianus TaxID=6549 RepID=UPI002248459E|nr:uncharacterized protein LOC127706297 [Mytilus californianus]